MPDLARPASRRTATVRVRPSASVLAGLVAVAALLVAPIAATAQPATGTSGDDAAAELREAEAMTEEGGLRVDATTYAGDHDVTHAEAVARLVAQQEYSALIEQIAAGYPATFAGSDVDHGDDYGLILYFTSAQDPATISDHIAAAELSRPQVRVETSALLSASESTTLVEAIQIPSSLDGLIDGIDYEPATHSLELDVLAGAVTDDTASALEAQIAHTASVLDLPAPSLVLRSKATGAADGDGTGSHVPSSIEQRPRSDR